MRTTAAVDDLLVPPSAWPQRPWRRWQSWLLVLVVAAVDLLLLAAPTTGNLPESTSVRIFTLFLTGQLILAPVAAIALLFRFRYPRLVTVSLMLLQFGMSAASLVAYFHLASRRVSRQVLLIAGLQIFMQVLSVTLFALLVPGFAGPVAPVIMIAVYGVFAVLMVSAVTALAGYRGSRRDVLNALHERAVRAEAERAASADHARLAERQLIAREMHDVLAHRMSLVTLHAGALTMQAGSLGDGAKADRLRRSAELVRENSQLALDELRDVLGVLREDENARLAPPLGLTDVPGLVRSWSQTGVGVQLHDPDRLTDPATPLPAQVSRNAARVIRESMTNSVRHSPGGWVRIDLGTRPGWVQIHVSNGPPAGAPVPRTSGAGHGLLGLRERVHLAGGELDAHPSPSGGFVVRASLPLGRDPRGVDADAVRGPALDAAAEGEAPHPGAVEATGELPAEGTPAGRDAPSSTEEEVSA